MQFDDDRLPYEKPTLLCLTLEPEIAKGNSVWDDEENMGGDVEQPTHEDETTPDPLA